MIEYETNFFYGVFFTVGEFIFIFSLYFQNNSTYLRPIYSTLLYIIGFVNRVIIYYTTIFFVHEKYFFYYLQNYKM